MKYVCKANFLDGKDANKQLVQYKIGQEYKGERAEEFLAKDMIVAEVNLDKATIEEIQGLIASKKEELSALEEKLKTLEAKKLAHEESVNESESNGEEEEHDEAGDLELEKAHEKMPRGLSKKEQKAWHKKHG